MTRVCTLIGDTRRMGLEDDIDDVADWNITMVRPFVVSPAQMYSHPIFRNICKRMIKRLDMQFELFAKFSDGRIGELDMAAHRKVRTIDLEDQAGFVNGVILSLHRVGERSQIGLVGLVVVITQKD